ncbi:ty3-gypsy retrotransposon protein [Tanacetum coccineum]
MVFQILILIDSGATHNFISKKLATALGLTIKPVKRLQISLGDGSRVWIEEQCNNVSIQFGSYSCIVDALVYNLGLLDMILGIARLGTLGDVLFNWQTRQVRFWSQGNYIQLQRVSSNLDSHSSLQTFLNGQIDQVSIKLDPPSTLNDEQLKDLSAMLSQFSMLFQAPQGLPPPRSIEHAINLVAGQGPICVRPYRYPHLHKDEIQRQVQEMFGTGFIRVSQSAYSSPIILVKKKDSSWKLCIDYQALNRATIPDKYPIPMVEELLDELHGSQFFLKIDLKSGFYQVRVCVLVFFDDILVCSDTWDAHIKLLTEVLQLLQKHQWVGVSMDPAKIKSIRNWSTLKNVKAVRGFLGLTSYYHKFIEGYGKIVKPLTELTKKDGFLWCSEAQSAFENLKKIMASAPVPALPNFSQPFEIGIGAVLMQSQRPIAYFSKALSYQNLNKSAYEKEIMALVLAIQHWRPYLLGRSFTIFTDQKSLKFLLEQRITTIDQQNWVTKLLGYRFMICYKPGKENRVADALSRIPEVGELCSMVSYP